MVLMSGQMRNLSLSAALILDLRRLPHLQLLPPQHSKTPTHIPWLRMAPGFLALILAYSAMMSSTFPLRPGQPIYFRISLGGKHLQSRGA